MSTTAATSPTTAAPIYLTRDDPKYSIDPDDRPAVCVPPGARLIVETHDARTGQLKHADEVMSSAPDYGERFPKTVPVTGPIFVDGAEPGDALVVDILLIEPDEYGFLIVKPKLGLVQGLVNQDTAKVVQVRDGMVEFDRFRFPVRSMVGVIGTAQAEGPVGTIYNGRYGGNLDSTRIAPGARVRMPVRVPGGLLYLGDCHASMGDGEACGTGVEVGARVHVRVGLEKGGATNWPWVETEDRWITNATAPTYEEASELAAREMIALLGDRLGVSPVDAFMLISATGDIRANQACRYPIDVSVRVEFPKLASTGVSVP